MIPHLSLTHHVKAALALIAALTVSLQTSAAITERNVNVHNTSAGITLAGTLTAPSGHTPRAVIVMATGSGQQNRDEELMGHKPFKVIAEYLSERGYAVLRMDDRGTALSQGDFATATTDDFVTDITAGLHFVDSCYRHSIPVGVIGHSEGGTIAIKTALGCPDCDFIVTLAAPAWKGDSIIMSQARAVTEAMAGHWDAESRQRNYLDIAMSETPAFMARAMLSAAISDDLGDTARLPAVQNGIARQLDVMMSPWYRTMLRYNPADDIKAVKCPWLALNGDRDMQVLPQNLATIAQLNPSATTVLLPDHNHLFQHCKTGLPQEYASIIEDISDDTLAAIAHWLNTSVGTR